MEKLKNEIIKYCKDNEVEFPMSDTYQSDLPNLTNHLESECLISYNIEYRDNDSDNWLQSEYCSKIGATIIFDYDCQSDFATIEELIEYLSNMEERIKTFESSLELPLEDVIVEAQKEVVFTMPCDSEEEQKKIKELKSELYERYESVQICPNGNHEVKVIATNNVAKK